MRELGSFVIFMIGSFRRIERLEISFGNFTSEATKLGFNSIFIIVIVASFTGAVSAIQTAFNLTAPYIQDYIIALVVRDTIFSLIPTLTALVYAGKAGSQIAGELGSMRVSEQIDALEVMGINAKSYLVFPKIMASLLAVPTLIIIGCFLAILGGYITVVAVDIISATDYIRGIRSDFNPFIITVIMVKSVIFGILVASISSYEGFYTRGGALEVGRSSTKSVIKSCISILLADYLVTQIMVG